MKIYADTANIEEIKSIAAMGLLDGVTTNPSLVAKEAGEFKEIMYNICEVVNGPVHAEPVSLDAAPMEKESRELAAIHKNIVVKIPMTPVGLAVCKKLSNDGIPVNITSYSTLRKHCSAPKPVRPMLHHSSAASMIFRISVLKC